VIDDKRHLFVFFMAFVVKVIRCSTDASKVLQGLVTLNLFIRRRSIDVREKGY
jgi:hypothetical protein